MIAVCLQKSWAGQASRQVEGEVPGEDERAALEKRRESAGVGSHSLHLQMRRRRGGN